MVNVVGVRLANGVVIVIVRLMKPALKVHASQAQAARVGTVHAMPQRTVTLVLPIVALALLLLLLLLLVQIVLSRQLRVYAQMAPHHALSIKSAQKYLRRGLVSTVPEVV